MRHNIYYALVLVCHRLDALQITEITNYNLLIYCFPVHAGNSSHCEMKLDKRCYWKKNDTLTWYKARNVCINEGGDLASFDVLSKKDLKDSLKDLRLTIRNSYWIGIYKSVWRWNDEGIGRTFTSFNNSGLKTAICLAIPRQVAVPDGRYIIYLICTYTQTYVNIYMHSI